MNKNIYNLAARYKLKGYSSFNRWLIISDNSSYLNDRWEKEYLKIIFLYNLGVIIRRKDIINGRWAFYIK